MHVIAFQWLIKYERLKEDKFCASLFKGISRLDLIGLEMVFHGTG